MPLFWRVKAPFLFCKGEKNMRCHETVLINTANGKRYVRASIYADTTPNTMPEDGALIEGLDANDVLAADSTMYIIASGDLYMLNGAGTWVKQ